jgi:hypothetical protein
MIHTRPVMIWVHPTFKKKLKVESAQNEVSIIEFTRKLAESKEEVPTLVKKKPFTFRL